MSGTLQKHSGLRSQSYQLLLGALDCHKEWSSGTISDWIKSGTFDPSLLVQLVNCETKEDAAHRWFHNLTNWIIVAGDDKNFGLCLETGVSTAPFNSMPHNFYDSILIGLDANGKLTETHMEVKTGSMTIHDATKEKPVFLDTFVPILVGKDRPDPEGFVKNYFQKTLKFIKENMPEKWVCPIGKPAKQIVLTFNEQANWSVKEYDGEPAIMFNLKHPFYFWGQMATDNFLPAISAYRENKFAVGFNKKLGTMGKDRFPASYEETHVNLKDGKKKVIMRAGQIMGMKPSDPTWKNFDMNQITEWPNAMCQLYPGGPMIEALEKEFKRVLSVRGLHLGHEKFKGFPNGFSPMKGFSANKVMKIQAKNRSAVMRTMARQEKEPVGLALSTDNTTDSEWDDLESLKVKKGGEGKKTKGNPVESLYEGKLGVFSTELTVAEKKGEVIPKHIYPDVFKTSQQMNGEVLVWPADFDLWHEGMLFQLIEDEDSLISTLQKSNEGVKMAGLIAVLMRNTKTKWDWPSKKLHEFSKGLGDALMASDVSRSIGLAIQFWKVELNAVECPPDQKDFPPPDQSDKENYERFSSLKNKLSSAIKMPEPPNMSGNTAYMPTNRMKESPWEEDLKLIREMTRKLYNCQSTTVIWLDLASDEDIFLASRGPYYEVVDLLRLNGKLEGSNMEQMSKFRGMNQTNSSITWDEGVKNTWKTQLEDLRRHTKSVLRNREFLKVQGLEDRLRKLLENTVLSHLFGLAESVNGRLIQAQALFEVHCTLIAQQENKYFRGFPADPVVHNNLLYNFKQFHREMVLTDQLMTAFRNILAEVIPIFWITTGDPYYLLYPKVGWWNLTEKWEKTSLHLENPTLNWQQAIDHKDGEKGRKLMRMNLGFKNAFDRLEEEESSEGEMDATEKDSMIAQALQAEMYEQLENELTEMDNLRIKRSRRNRKRFDQPVAESSGSDEQMPRERSSRGRKKEKLSAEELSKILGATTNEPVKQIEEERVEISDHDENDMFGPQEHVDLFGSEENFDIPDILGEGSVLEDDFNFNEEEFNFDQPEFKFEDEEDDFFKPRGTEEFNFARETTPPPEIVKEQNVDFDALLANTEVKTKRRRKPRQLTGPELLYDERFSELDEYEDVPISELDDESVQGENKGEKPTPTPRRSARRSRTKRPPTPQEESIERDEKQEVLNFKMEKFLEKTNPDHRETKKYKNQRGKRAKDEILAINSKQIDVRFKDACQKMYKAGLLVTYKDGCYGYWENTAKPTSFWKKNDYGQFEWPFNEASKKKILEGEPASLNKALFDDHHFVSLSRNKKWPIYLMECQQQLASYLLSCRWSEALKNSLDGVTSTDKSPEHYIKEIATENENRYCHLDGKRPGIFGRMAGWLRGK